MFNTMPRDVLQGMESLKRFRQQHPDAPIYGMAYELFDVPSEFSLAAHATAASSIFYYVVENDETVQRVHNWLRDTRSPGHATFLPLNRLRSKTSNASIREEDAVPLMSKVTLKDERYRVAIEQLFGKTYCCSKLDVATALSKQHRVQCVTLDGEIVNDKGSITGGYYDPKGNRMLLAKAVGTLRQQVAKVTEAKNLVDAELQSSEAAKLKVETDKRQLEEQLATKQRAVEALQADIKNAALSKSITSSKLDDMVCVSPIGTLFPNRYVVGKAPL